MSKQNAKFKCGENQGILSYTVNEQTYMALSESNSAKVQYIKENKIIEISFKTQPEHYDSLPARIIDDPATIQKVYDELIESGNAWFKNGIENLCVTEFGNF